jgi:hypothetical protein
VGVQEQNSDSVRE